MPPDQTATPDPPKKNFTNEQIRAKAYQIWEKNKEQSKEDNWNAAVKGLERERRFRVLIGIWRWTGLGEKKGWDIFIQLLSTVSIPLLLFFGTQYFTNQNNERQQKIAEQNKIEQEIIAEQKQKDDLLKTYINDMKGFLLDEKHSLKKSKENDEIRSIARTITLTTLTQLNSNQDEQRSKDGKYNQRKGLIMQFLFESGLIKIDLKVASIISLNTADFTFTNLESAKLNGAKLESAKLESANLYGANLYGANLQSANLIDANLIDAKLIDANLERANLLGANLYGANLQSANLQSANLIDANLDRANLVGAKLQSAKLQTAKLIDANLYSANLQSANLQSANLYSANLYSANLIDANLESAKLESANLYKVLNLTNSQIKSACYWKNAIYTEAEFDQNTFLWAAKNVKANQEKIDRIEQDRASDPKTLPDCSRWE